MKYLFLLLVTSVSLLGLGPLDLEDNKEGKWEFVGTHSSAEGPVVTSSSFTIKHYKDYMMVSGVSIESDMMIAFSYHVSFKEEPEGGFRYRYMNAFGAVDEGLYVILSKTKTELHHSDGSISKFTILTDDGVTFSSDEVTYSNQGELVFSAKGQSTWSPFEKEAGVSQ